MLEFVLKGGPLMLPIFLCSVIAVAIILERLIYFQRAKLKPADFLSQIEKFLKAGKPEKALNLIEDNSGPVVSIVEAGIKNYKRASSRWEKVVSMAGSRQLRKLETNLRGLGIIGHISPLLGLLGTVTGMIKCFMKIQELGGRVDASVLAGGIWEALITTATGLSVAIPAIIFYHYFEGKLDNFSSQMKNAAEMLMEWLGIEEPRAKEDRQPREDVEYGV